MGRGGGWLTFEWIYSGCGYILEGNTYLFIGGVGDLYIQAKVETPINLSKKQIEILRSFKEIEDVKDSPLKSAFFKKAKKFWSNK